MGRKIVKVFCGQLELLWCILFVAILLEVLISYQKIKKIFIGSDHGGFNLKIKIRDWLRERKFSVEDLGCQNSDSCDYPQYAVQVGEKVSKTNDSLGVVICGSGVGVSIAANKVSGVRCVLANSIEIARLGKEHNGANILAMGERTSFTDDPFEILEEFLKTNPSEEERHISRRNQLDAL